jgi:hypothetical protein
MQPLPSVFIQGLGSCSADNLNTFVQTVVNVAGARNFIGLSNMVMNLQGYVAPNDGGQGLFYWFSGAGSVDDNGVTTIVPAGAAGQGAWVRLSLSGITPGSIINADLAPMVAYTIKGNDTAISASPQDLTQAQAASILAGQGANTLAAGNDSRFTYVGQSSHAASYTLLATDAAVEQKWTATATLTLPAGVFQPSTAIPIRVEAGAVLTIQTGTGATLTWVPTGATGTRTVTGPAYTVITVDTATSYWIGAGGVS